MIDIVSHSNELTAVSFEDYELGNTSMILLIWLHYLFFIFEIFILFSWPIHNNLQVRPQLGVFVEPIFDRSPYHSKAGIEGKHSSCTVLCDVLIR